MSCKTHEINMPSNEIKNKFSKTFQTKGLLNSYYNKFIELQKNVNYQAYY